MLLLCLRRQGFEAILIKSAHMCNLEFASGKAELSGTNAWRACSAYIVHPSNQKIGNARFVTATL